ncbi:MAG: TatD family hydrolase [Candidatus Peribacteria bacterium]|nr:MAG: TatD family hydrolase [Candidatus Peribacteria bacterium]
MDDATFEQNIRIVEQVEDEELDCVVKTTRGWHPWEVVKGNLSGQSLDALHDQGAIMIEEYEDMVVAVGECGIDLHYEDASKTLQTQQAVLAEHGRLAMGYSLPLVVHSRDAFVETMDVLMDFPDLTVYMHCRGYGPEEIEEFLKRCPRGYIGFCGNITYPKADDLRASLQVVPMDRLVLETDAPYLAPQAVRGEKNRPALIGYTYDFVAAELDIEVDILKRQVTENFYRLYSL